MRQRLASSQFRTSESGIASAIRVSANIRESDVKEVPTGRDTEG
jgi:hypothetical protein